MPATTTRSTYNTILGERCGVESPARVVRDSHLARRGKHQSHQAGNQHAPLGAHQGPHVPPRVPRSLRLLIKSTSTSTETEQEQVCALGKMVPASYVYPSNSSSKYPRDTNAHEHSSAARERSEWIHTREDDMLTKAGRSCS